MRELPAIESERRAPLQFGLRTLLGVTTVFAVVFGCLTWFGALGTFLLLVAAGFVVVVSVPKLRRMWIVLPYAGFILTGLAIPALDTRRGCTATRTSYCANNLKQIGLALQTYHDVWKRFPPACTVDANGKPMHSWRVLILPYLENRALYEQYDFNEPWDGPHNRLLASEIPPYYRCPTESLRGPCDTAYAAIVGPETMWPGSKSSSLADVVDGAADTILVVESTGSGIDWMEPRDLPASAIDLGVNPPEDHAGIRGLHGGGAWALFVDGTVRRLHDHFLIHDLQGLVTRAGGEVVDEKH